MACSTAQNDKSLERPTKIETRLSEAQWHVLLRRTARPQRATPRKMETLLSEAQWHVRLCRIDRGPRRNAHFRLSNRIFDFWSEVFFVRSLTRKHHFRVGTKGRCYFRLFSMTEALCETPTFDFRVGFSTFDRRVFL